MRNSRYDNACRQLGVWIHADARMHRELSPAEYRVYKTTHGYIISDCLLACDKEEPKRKAGK